MELDHTFTVAAPIDAVWQAVTDPQRVAPCMPGARLTGVDGETFTGTVKVKLGPISLLYKGSGEFLAIDEAAHHVVIKASGSDARGNGTAAATVTVTLTGDGERTDGAVHSDVKITGRPAQFGRGMIAEVGGRILDSFADCLAGKLAGDAVDEAVQPASSQAPQAESSPAPESRPAPEPPTAAQPSAPKSESKTELKTQAAQPETDTEPLDLLRFAGDSIGKRLAPIAAAVLAVLVIVFWRGRRR